MGREKRNPLAGRLLPAWLSRAYAARRALLLVGPRVTPRRLEFSGARLSWHAHWSTDDVLSSGLGATLAGCGPVQKTFGRPSHLGV